MRITVKTTGFKDLDRTLSQIEKQSTRKAVMRRSLKAAAQPMADMAESLAPVGETHQLAPSVTVGTKLSKRQKRIHKKMFKNDKTAVEMFVGAGPLSSAHNQEFGNIHHGPQPFMRPAWDAEAMPILGRLGREMWSEIEKQSKRAARKAARDQQRG